MKIVDKHSALTIVGKYLHRNPVLNEKIQNNYTPHCFNLNVSKLDSINFCSDSRMMYFMLALRMAAAAEARVGWLILHIK